jgi:3',5'-cyclic AMP phosphodiesterase CpdA
MTPARGGIRITRREFLGGAVLGGAGLIAGCGPKPRQLLSQVDALPGPARRRVWAMGDSHIGCAGRANDGRDGADWLKLCLEDLRDRLAPVDYAVALGDLTHHAGPDDELRQYVRLRESSKVPVWYELAGNHDFAAVPAGRWRRHVGRPPRYALIDGTLAWFFVSAEQGKADGKVCRATAEWLVRSIARHQDRRNIVVCTHQAVYDTVSGSKESSCRLNHRGLIRSVLRRARVDLWLCGHIHGGRRNRRYVLEMAAGGRELLARCRDHDHDRWLDDQQVRLTCPHPWRFFAKPVLIPAPV